MEVGYCSASQKVTFAISEELYAPCTNTLCCQVHSKACNAMHSATAICNTRKCLLIKGLQKSTTNSFLCPKMSAPPGIPAAFCFSLLPPATCSQKLGAFPPTRAHGHMPCAKVFLAPPHHHRQSHFYTLTQAGWPCAFATRSTWSCVFLRMTFFRSSLLW